MNLSRRFFLGGVLAVATVTAIPRAALASFPDIPLLVGDGIHDDTAGLQALFDGKPFRTPRSKAFIAHDCTLDGGQFLVTRPVALIGRDDVAMHNCTFIMRGALRPEEFWFRIDACEHVHLTNIRFIGPKEAGSYDPGPPRVAYRNPKSLTYRHPAA